MRLLKRSVIAGLLAISVGGLMVLCSAFPSCTQGLTLADENLREASPPNSEFSLDRPVAGQPSCADPAASGNPQQASSAADDAWRLSVGPYLSFPGVHGTGSGPNGSGLGFSASSSDLLSHFRFGLVGAVEVQQKWLVPSLEMMWIPLGDTKNIPYPNLGMTSADIKVTDFLLTPKVGVRLIKDKMFKIEALTGFRYWHLGESFTFNPSSLYFSGSQNIVDPLVGGRIQVALSPKVVVNVLGEVGGWGAASQLEYQAIGLLGYTIKPTPTLQPAYSNLNIDYRNSRGFVFNATTSGFLFGATINLT